MSDVTSLRAAILREAERLVTGDRNVQYGPPDADFARTAHLWTALGFAFKNERGYHMPVNAHQVAMAMIALKLSRLSWSPGKEDSWVDLAGYAACGGEIAVTRAAEEDEDEDEEYPAKRVVIRTEDL